MTTMQTAPRSLHELASRYLEAWNDHDLEAILALHTPDTEFHINGIDGVVSAVGIDACRETFAYLLRAWPDQRFELNRLTVRDDWEDFWIVRWQLTGALALPWEMGGRTFEPSAAQVSFAGNDMMYCEGNLIKVKDSWIDGLAIRAQLERNAS